MAGFDHFTHFAPFYDRTIPFKALKSLLVHGGFTGDEIVLDAGGGTGRVASAIKPFVREVIVADLSNGMLGQAMRKGLETLLSPVEFLPFQSGIFDRILMIDALHHVHNQTATAYELWRTLKPEGMIIIEEPDVRKFPVKIVALAERVALMRSHFLPPADIADLFRKFSSGITVSNEGFNTWVIIRK
jgi:ubiquinone/menaquinone biosynthesis C-methylase UbiE